MLLAKKLTLLFFSHALGIDMQIVILIYCIMVANILKLAVFATFYFRSFCFTFPLFIFIYFILFIYLFPLFISFLFFALCVFKFFALFYFRSFLLYFPFLGVFCFFQHFILGVS